MNNQRPQAVTIAAVMLALFSSLNVVSAFIPALSDGVPAAVVYGSVVLGLVGLAGAYGLWSLKKWGVWLAIVLSVLNVLSAAPGIAFAPTTLLFVFAFVTIVAYAFVIVLVILPVSRRAYA